MQPGASSRNRSQHTQEQTQNVEGQNAHASALATTQAAQVHWRLQVRSKTHTQITIPPTWPRQRRRARQLPNPGSRARYTSCGLELCRELGLLSTTPGRMTTATSVTRVGLQHAPNPTDELLNKSLAQDTFRQAWWTPLIRQAATKITPMIRHLSATLLPRVSQRNALIK